MKYPAPTLRHNINITEMMDHPQGGHLEQAELIHNILIIQEVADRDVGPEEPDTLWVYELPQEVADRLRSYPANERSISVEYYYEDDKGNRLEVDEYDEDEHESYHLELDLSI